MKKILGILVGLIFLSGCGDDDGFTFEEQLAIDIATIEGYLNDNGITTQLHESGIRFVEIEPGEGRSPVENEVAVVKYDMMVIGGDESIAESLYGDSFTLDNNLMRALFLMLQEVQVGGRLTFYAPSGYCFGDASSDLIPANSNLVFNLELVNVVRTEAEQFVADTTILETYLDINSIDAQTHESGARYLILLEGDGDSPEITDEVRVIYEGRFLNGGLFDQNQDGVLFGLEDLIEAWQIMIPTMKVGGTMTIYAPSKLCYGSTGNRLIPPNTNLVFDIELLSIN